MIFICHGVVHNESIIVKVSMILLHYLSVDFINMSL